MIVQIKGCNGSGKSTIPLQMVAREMYPEYEDHDKFALTWLPTQNWVLVGEYDPAAPSPTNNGCDRIGKVALVKEAILQALYDHAGANVLFEGMMISTIKSTFYEFLLDQHRHGGYDIRFVILDTTPDACVARLDARGTKKAGLKFDNIASKCASIKRHALTYDPEYVAWLPVDEVRRDGMLDAFFMLVGDQTSYMDIVRMGDDEVRHSLDNMGIDHAKMDCGQAKRELGAQILDPVEVNRSEVLHPSIGGPWLGQLCLYVEDELFEEVGYVTSTGHELSMLVHLVSMDRSDVPMLTEYEQMIACGTCKGSNGACPGFAPRFDKLKPKIQRLYVLALSIDMAWALKYGAHHTAFMPSSWADILTVSYARRMMKAMEKSGFYTLGASNCPGCHKGCAARKTGRCVKPSSRRFSMEAMGIDCDWLHSDLYDEWLPWLQRGTNTVPYYMTRYVGILSDSDNVPVVFEMAMRADKTYLDDVPDTPEYPTLHRIDVVSGVHEGCYQLAYDMPED